MPDENPKAYSLVLVISGAFREPGDEVAQLPIETFLRRVEDALMTTWPGFLPGNPPVTVVTSELRDDWIKR
jgi:hypothetical protein